MFAFWAIQATIKYFDADLSTTSFKTSSEDLRSELPFITLCPYSQLYSAYENNLDMSNANEMINNDYFYHFHERLANEFKNSSFNMSELNATMYYAIEDLVDAVYINDHILQENHGQLWKPAYHYKYGLC